MTQPKGDLQLAIGYWIVSHKQSLKRWLILMLMFFIAGSWLWTSAFFLVFFRQRAVDDTILGQTATRIGRLATAVNPPQDLTLSPATFLTRDRQHIDLVARVTNPNSAWGAVRMVYHWLVGGVSTLPEETFINPGVTRPVISLNVGFDQRPAEADLIIDRVEWARVGRASLPPAEFVTETSTLTPTTITIGGQPVVTVSLQATITNRSVYNFFRVLVPVLVLADDRIVAADLLTFERWPTLTSRTVVSNWSYAVNGATAAEIAPQVSQFAADNIYR